MLLKKTLVANALFCFTCGVLLLLLTGPIANWLGNPPLWTLFTLGLSLIVFAADVVWISRGLPESLFRARIIFWADTAWVVLTPFLILIFRSVVPYVGIFLLIDIAVVVALFAWLEWKGLQQLTNFKPA